MHMLFVDESGTPPEPARTGDQPYFVLGGIVIPEDIWAKMAADMTRLKQQFEVVGELKWRHFAPDRGGRVTPLSHLSPERKESLRSELYDVIRRYKSVRLICVVVSTADAYRQPFINSADALYQQAYKLLTERFQYFIQDLERTVGQKLHGITVCDHRGPKDDARLRELHHRLMTSSGGTISNYKNMIEGLFIAPSHLSVGIQFADLVAGAVFRAFSNGDTRFADQLKDSFRTSDAGVMEGYGLVKFPKKWEKT